MNRKQRHRMVMKHWRLMERALWGVSRDFRRAYLREFRRRPCNSATGANGSAWQHARSARREPGALAESSGRRSQNAANRYTMS